eukprot:TRINITY_DN1696_c0_g1_i3.p1 TRINITY_DN1696_c0_g1~~TRINITY_DN1696_c0_g1_i3.p1  ORF type:complete len:112 (-),score=29.69 TRINITY_DN1696_c0_g1_i3:134-469(-)
MIRRPPRSTQSRSSAASDVYKRQIMDGNGRWAKQKGLFRSIGHENGSKAVREIVEGCAEIGIPYLTLYAFSTENWNRPKMEVELLMKLLICLLYTSPSPRDRTRSRMPSSA